MTTLQSNQAKGPVFSRVFSRVSNLTGGRHLVQLDIRPTNQAPSHCEGPLIAHRCSLMAVQPSSLPGHQANNLAGSLIVHRVNNRLGSLLNNHHDSRVNSHIENQLPLHRDNRIVILQGVRPNYQVFSRQFNHLSSQLHNQLFSLI